MDRPLNLRASFDLDPQRYDRARPGYPAQLFDDLEALAGLGRGSRVLEIGPGTGQATLPLARRGYEIVAVELGGGLAELARRKLAPFTEVEVVNAAFEEWPLPPEPFDAVVCATAYHWLDPAAGPGRIAAALRPGGVLAVITTWHVAGGDRAFFAAVQRCYERHMPGTAPGERLPDGSAVPTAVADLERGGRFTRAVVRRYEREIGYSTAEYLDVLCTYSGHLALAEEARESLLDCVRRLIDDRHGGRIAKRYLNELAVAYRAP